MIINCDCGIQFLVKKSEIGPSGRDVQCGVCNRKWFFGQKNNKDNTIKEKLEKKYSSPFLYKLTIFIILFLGIVGIINLLEEFLVNLNFQFKDFFELKNRIENKLFNFFINN